MSFKFRIKYKDINMYSMVSLTAGYIFAAAG